jgi:hypothetical protein
MFSSTRDHEASDSLLNGSCRSVEGNRLVVDGTEVFLCALDLIAVLLSDILDLGLELLDRCIRLGDARVDVLEVSDQSCRQRKNLGS